VERINRREVLKSPAEKWSSECEWCSFGITPRFQTENRGALWRDHHEVIGFQNDSRAWPGDFPAGQMSQYTQPFLIFENIS